MFKRSHRRPGFTLPEVLVTVAIVAVLAAVVVPAVTQQLSKGDAPSLQSSIGSIKTGITAFVSDVRKFPRRLSHLSNPIFATDSALQANTPFGTASNRWKGPYVGQALSFNDSLPIGMNLKALDSLELASGMIRMNLSGTTDTMDLHNIDLQIDNGTGKNGGNLRWTATTATASAVHYLLGGAQ
jgi:prepilin-type N-terminal cleavage/methylation domain-containing protein